MAGKQSGAAMQEHSLKHRTHEDRVRGSNPSAPQDCCGGSAASPRRDAAVPDRAPAVPGRRAAAPGGVDHARLSSAFKALADPNRLKILSIVAAAAEVCVCDLPEPLGLTQPTVSHHLRVLVEAGFLAREKRGVWAYFSLVPGALEGLSHELLFGVAARGDAR